MAFKKLQSFDTSYAATAIAHYVSLRSGLHVVVAQRPGPKLHGYFALATEIHDDSGAPHTLEHLVFMGSRTYPYKGLLDKLASRAYAGTNAWTATDHTAYTLETAGWDGFAQILPVYLEHVLVPTLTDDGCLTEVHHVDGKGKDAGVVYAEMQGLQSDSGELMDLQLRRMLYPEGVGFRYETGGMVEALRVLTPERIRDFHKAMYQPRNLAVVIVGEVNEPDLLAILNRFEESIADVLPPIDSPFQRPWIDSTRPPLLTASTTATVEFPDDDESTGSVLVGFFGPDCNDVVATSALNVLLTYLCGSSAAVLENNMVEREALASAVSYQWEPRWPYSLVMLQPTGVEVDKLETVEQRLWTLLEETASSPLDMAYLRDCIRRERRQVQHQAESDEGFYSAAIITDYLFGARDGSTLADLKDLHEYDVLEQWTEDQWQTFLRRWFVDAHHVSVLGKPSRSLAKKLKAAEKERLAKRRQELGEDGLKELQNRLDLAKKHNDQPIPEDVLDQWPVPGTESIHFIESHTARAGTARKLGILDNAAQSIIDKSKPAKHPLFLQFEDVPSNFVRITLHVGTSTVPKKLKPLLWNFIDNFFNTPVLVDGKKLPFEDVVKQLEHDTVSYSVRSGAAYGDAESLAIQIQLEPSKYLVLIHHLKTLLYDAVDDPVRIHASVAKALADIPEAKRDGRLMAAEIDMALHLDPDSFPAAKRTLVRAVYLKRLQALLKTDPDVVVGWFRDLRKALFAVENMRVLVTADVEALGKSLEGGLVSSWDGLVETDNNLPTLDITPPASRRSPEGQHPGRVGAVVVPMAALDSSYSVATAATRIESYSDPRLPSLLVALGYLEAVEGPLWVAVRGNGLAYGVHFGFRDVADHGLLQFRVYRSPDASKAVAASRKTIEDLATGRTPLDKHLVQGAVSQIVVDMADEQATLALAAQQNFVTGVVRGLDRNWSRQLMAAARAVTDDQIRDAMATFVVPVFRPETSNMVVTCAPLGVEPIQKALAEMGYKTQTKKLKDYFDAYGMPGEEEEEEEEEESEGEDEDEDEDDDEDDDDDDDEDDSDEDDSDDDR